LRRGRRGISRSVAPRRGAAAARHDLVPTANPIGVVHGGLAATLLAHGTTTCLLFSANGT
jgi:hypothetical protein